MSPREQIARLVSRQKFGVLCTQWKKEPYGSMIAFWPSRGLGEIYFFTPKQTRKYRSLLANPLVAVQIDDRLSRKGRAMAISSVTGIGRAVPLGPGKKAERVTRHLLCHHPYLRAFVSRFRPALVEVKVRRYELVGKLSETAHWSPSRG
jgi:nitroimidazol reductase NimA-like FMN-containing flavoprotein (pyridoxamine 5'-phosphate oxidase superfamily)